MHIVKTQAKYLQEQIKCFYSVCAANADEVVSAHRRLPDGTLDIVFNLGSAVSLSHNGLEFSEMPAVALTGLYQQRKFIRYKGPVHLVGVVFQPGFAHSFVNDTLEHFRESALDASLLFGKEISLLAEQLKNTTGEPEKHHILEYFLLKFFREKDNSGYSSRIFRVIQQIHQQEGNVIISDLYKENFMSARTFRRKFNECVGMSPKQYAAITRVKSFSKRYELSRSSSYTDIFSDLGYTDQSHFSRDFQKIAGTSPASYFKQLDEIGSGFIHLI